MSIPIEILNQHVAILGLHPNGGSYGTNLGRLRTMGIITARGPITITDGLIR